MRGYVFTDPALARHAGRFVWLEIDTEKSRNASFSKQFDITALPTFPVLDPATEKVALRWVGGATVAQLDKILDDGRLAVAHAAEAAGPARPDASPGRRDATDADRALARADRLYGDGDNAAAAVAYQEPLGLAPAGWPRYARAVDRGSRAREQ